MNPAMIPCTAPPGFYGGPYLPSFNQCGYPYPCTPVPGNYPVPFPGYGGPLPQPFFGPPQPCSSMPYAYGPYPGMFPPGYMVPQQAYPQPCMYGGPPVTTPLIQSRNEGAVHSPVMSPNEIPNNIHDQEQRTGSAPLRPGDGSNCKPVLSAAVNHQQQMPTLTATVHQQQISTVTCKSPPGFPLIPSGDISPAGMQWNTMVSKNGLHVPGISKSPYIQDRDETEDRSVELWQQSSEHSTASCQTTLDTDKTYDSQQIPDLTISTQPCRSDALPEHSNKSVVNAQASSNSEEPSYQELATEQEETAASSLLDLPVHEKEIGEALIADSTPSVPVIAVCHDTTGSDSTGGSTRFTWSAADKNLNPTYREYLVCVLHFVDHGLGIPSGLPLENKCWAVPWLTELI